MKNLKSLGKTLNKIEQKAINGGFGNDCGIFVCAGDGSNEGCICWDNPNPPAHGGLPGQGTCFNGMCCD